MSGLLTRAAIRYRGQNRSIRGDRDPDAGTGAAGELRRAGQMGDNLVDVFLAIVVAGVVAYVGLQVAADTEDSSGFDTGADAINRTQFENAAANINEGFETSFGLFDVAAIAFMLAIIVGALMLVRQSR